MLIKARDVAAAAGVSVSTIGRALADDPRISDETKALVREHAQLLGYVGNDAAQMMRGRSSQLIGLLIPDVANVFYALVAQVMSECLNSQGYRLLLSLTQDDPDVELRHIRELTSARASGIILVPTPAPRDESRLLLARVAHVQFLRHAPALGDSWFGIDDEAALRQAATHLLSQGHRRIAYVGGSERLSTGRARLAGFRAAMRAGRAAKSGLERLGTPSTSFGEASCRELLSLDSPPTAMLTGSVHITEGVIAAIEALHIKVPQRLSLIGFGTAPWFAWWRGGLSVVAPPVEELAKGCALWLLEQLAAKTPQTAHSSVTPSQFLARRTTALLGD